LAHKQRPKKPKQPPPRQFRPGPELEQLVTSFAAENGLQPNEACKVLVALAVITLDVRYYGLMRQLAEGMGGANAFVRACVHIHTSLAAARLATGTLIKSEVERLRIIVGTVQAFLARKGRQLQTEGMRFTAEQDVEHGEPEWSSFEEQPQQQQRIGT
jgi:hypothetical protein